VVDSNVFPLLAMAPSAVRSRTVPPSEPFDVAVISFPIGLLISTAGPYAEASTGMLAARFSPSRR